MPIFDIYLNHLANYSPIQPVTATSFQKQAEKLEKMVMIELLLLNHFIKLSNAENIMAEKVPEDIKNDLEKAICLHQRATADYAQCEEFSKLMSSILSRLEDAGCYDTADRVMTILLDCNPKTGSHCDKSTQVGNQTIKLNKYYE